MALTIVTHEEATGRLAEAYRQVLARPVPPGDRPAHGTAGIVQAHGLDPALIPRVFGCASTLHGAGPLTWTERELVGAITSRLGQCAHGTACHAAFLRVALEDDALPRAVIADPHAVATRWPAPRPRALAALARAVTEAPWSLTTADRAAAHAAGLDDEAVLHAIALAAFVGHLDRIADVVAVPPDLVVDGAPAIEPAAPALAEAPLVVDDAPAIDLALRPATALALDAWRAEVFERDPGWLSAARRAWLADHVAAWLGAPGPAPAPPVDDQAGEQLAFARLVTLAPWRASDAALAPLRARGWDDAGLFDLTAVITTATVLVRIEVALRALARPPAEG